MNKETLSTSEKEVPKHKNALEEKYIGRYIDADIDGVKVSNPSYKKYYKELV